MSALSDRAAVLPPPLQAPLCPLCGRPNGCAAVASGTLAAECWCRSVTFPPELLARVPAAQAGTACICRACAESVHADRTEQAGEG